MKRYLILLMLLAGSVQAQTEGRFLTGTTFFEWCDHGPEDRKSLECAGYAAGFRNGYAKGHALGMLGEKGFCIPEQATHGQVDEVLIRYLMDHPETRDQGLARLATAAFIEAWPCKE